MTHLLHRDVLGSTHSSIVFGSIIILDILQYYIVVLTIKSVSTSHPNAVTLRVHCTPLVQAVVCFCDCIVGVVYLSDAPLFIIFRDYIVGVPYLLQPLYFAKHIFLLQKVSHKFWLSKGVEPVWGRAGSSPPTPGNSIGVKMKEEKREEQRKKRE